MAERSMFWNGAVTGDCGPYSSQQFMDYFWRVITNGTGNRGVLMNWLNELEVTDGGANTATVATGASINYGLFYENDTAVNVNVPNGPRTDLIVIRRDWAAQTSRITRIAGPGAALVQNIGVTYDIPLASVVVDGVGALTITDTREFCLFSTIAPSGGVQNAHLQADSVTTSELINQTRWLTRGAGQLYPDATNPASWVNTSIGGNMSDLWRFRNGQTDTVWGTFRVPADFTGANISVRLWLSAIYGIAGDSCWAFSAWVAASGAVLANQTGAATFTHVATDNSYRCSEFTIGNLPVAANDIVHIEIYRDGTNPAETFLDNNYLFIAQFQYTADS